MKVGDYVRTNNGDIGILTKVFNEGEFIIDTYPDEVRYDCIKSSPNIIDLIEVGDYVNGYLIEKVYDVFETSPNKLKEAHVRYADEDFISQLYDTEIKSIVTKELFSSMEYKVGE